MIEKIHKFLMLQTFDKYDYKLFLLRYYWMKKKDIVM